MNELIDVSIFCGHWPFRNLPLRTPGALKSHLQERGVTRAWVASTEAVLYPDPMEGNEPLFEAIAGDDFFLPVAIIDVTLASWRRDAQACLQKWGCRAFKLLPNYHHYPLSHPAVAELVSLAQEARVPVCIQMRMMDERSHHACMMVPGVAPEPIVWLAREHPEARFLVCGAYWRELPTLGKAPNIWAETSLVERARSLHDAVQALGPERVVFGSHSPFLYFEAAAAKLDIDPLDVAPEVVQAVRGRNIALLLGS